MFIVVADWAPLHGAAWCDPGGLVGSVTLSKGGQWKERWQKITIIQAVLLNTMGWWESEGRQAFPLSDGAKKIHLPASTDRDHLETEITWKSWRRHWTQTSAIQTSASLPLSPCAIRSLLSASNGLSPEPASPSTHPAQVSSPLCFMWVNQSARFFPCKTDLFLRYPLLAYLLSWTVHSSPPSWGIPAVLLPARKRRTAQFSIHSRNRGVHAKLRSESPPCLAHRIK